MFRITDSSNTGVSAIKTIVTALLVSVPALGQVATQQMQQSTQRIIQQQQDDDRRMANEERIRTQQKEEERKARSHSGEKNIKSTANHPSPRDETTKVLKAQVAAYRDQVGRANALFEGQRLIQEAREKAASLEKEAQEKANASAAALAAQIAESCKVTGGKLDVPGVTC